MRFNVQYSWFSFLYMTGSTCRIWEVTLKKAPNIFCARPTQGLCLLFYGLGISFEIWIVIIYLGLDQYFGLSFRSNQPCMFCELYSSLCPCCKNFLVMPSTPGAIEEFPDDAIKITRGSSGCQSSFHKFEKGSLYKISTISLDQDWSILPALESLLLRDQ